MPVVTDYTALLSGDYWNGIEVTGKPVIVTYSFPTTAPAYLASVQGFTGSTVSSFQAFTADEQTQARAALGEWAAASGLTFVEVAPGKGDINFQLVDFDTTSSPSYSGSGGVAFYPFGNWDFSTYPSFSSDLDASGDVFMNSRFATSGQVNYGTLLHEIGHAIGLKHPTQVVTDNAPYPPVTHDQVLSSDDPTRTIMATVGDSSSGGDHIKQLDKDAAAFLYGPAGSGSVVTTSASGSNAVLSSWTWDAANQILTEKGKADNDVIRGSSVVDKIYGLAGNDRLFGLNGDDYLNGGAGNDLLDGGPGADKMYGGTEDDTYRVDNAGDRVVEYTDQGYDTVLAYVSTTLSANVEQLQLYGSGLVGKGNGLDNRMFGDGVNATKLYGLDGNDYIVGGGGADTLDGGTDADSLFGGAGKDVLTGGDGDDRLVGGPAVDVLTGGTGADTFVLANLTADHDTVRDFVSGTDHFELSASLFGGGLTAGSLDPSVFTVNTTGHATAPNQRLIYNSSNGALYSDSNGSAAGGYQLIASLTGAPVVASGDFSVVT